MANNFQYEYYTSGGIHNGLSADQSNFSLNNKQITLFSAAIHYFRIPPDYWRHYLRTIRAAGLNCIETYIPWNLHEPEIGLYDFGSNGTEFELFLDIKMFLKIAQEEDLFTIIRPGPYICSEWEFGGMPSWLLRYKDMKLRTSDKNFLEFVTNYFKALFSILIPLQFTKGGSIIAFQIENEYGNTKNIDKEYLENLKNIFTNLGIVELLFTSDTPSNGFCGTLPGILATANFQTDAVKELTLLKEFQPNKPLMVMEYWTGWFDHWSEKHHTRDTDDFIRVFEEIANFNSSVNFYMFYGGTNWGFLNGANLKDSSTDNSSYQPDTTSYDYDAPISENGVLTNKYHRLRKLMITKYNKIQVKIPEVPDLIQRKAYNSIQITNYLTIDDLIQQSNILLKNRNVIPMELLNINNNSGQSYGYIIYRKENLTIKSNSVLKIEGRICDSILVLINGELKSKILRKQSDLDDFGYWRLKDSTLSLGNNEYKNATLDLIIENWGRVNYGKLDQFNQQKGLWQGHVLINEEILYDWQIIPVEFRKNWTNSLEKWRKIDAYTGPGLYKGILNLNEDIYDTYIDMRGWIKGIVIVNGFVLSRYLRLGPQQAAYLPAPFLQKGKNIIIVFEHFRSSKNVEFADNPIYETVI